MRHLLASALALALAGCLLAPGSGSIFKQHKACRSDSECSQGEVCLDIGCTAPDQGLVVEVVPPANDPELLLPQDFANVDATRSVDLQLGPSGQLHFTSNSYPFRLELDGTSLNIPDLTFTLPSMSISSETTFPVRSGSYMLRAYPADVRVPPLVLSSPVPADGKVGDFELGFTRPDQLVRLDGALRASTLLESNASLSYDVRVLNDADGTPLSQVATTGAPDGGLLPFTIYLAPSVDPLEGLRLTASPHTGTGPTVKYHDTLASLQERLAADGGLSLGGFWLTEVSGQVLDPEGHPVAGAIIQLTADLPDEGHYASQATISDSLGNYRVVALHDRSDGAGDEAYMVVVSPPARTGLAIGALPAVARWADGGLSATFAPVTLNPLTPVTGRVLDTSGKPVPGTVVQATPTADNTLPLQSASTSTDTAGQYRLALSPGVYHLDFTPPAELSAPTASRGPLSIGNTPTQLEDLQFSAPRVVKGTVKSPTGRPIDGATIRVYYVPSAPAGTVVHSTLLGRSLALPDGSFTLILPAPATSK